MARHSKPAPRWLLSLLALLSLGGGIALALYGVRELKEAKASEAWPSVPGEVVQTRVEESRSGSSGSRSRPRKTRYRPEVEYAYAVGEQRFLSQRLSFSGSRSFDQRQGADAWLRDWPIGKEVTVFHDPARPDHATLERGAKAATWLPLGVGLGLALLIAPLMLLLMLRR